MKKCKRNILLIFGYLLVVIVLFIPCEKGNYFLTDVEEYPKDIPRLESDIPPPPGSDIPPLPEGFQFRTVFGHKKITRATLQKIEIKPLPSYIVNIINHKNFKKWKREEEKVWNSIVSNKDLITIEELFYLQNEFIDEYDGEFRFFSINADIYIIEIMLTFLIAGFAYILFCVILRKAKGE